MAQYSTKSKSILFTIVGSIFLCLTLLSSCEELGGAERKCRGCPEEQPWSILDGEYCYPTEEACMEGLSVSECEMCDRKPKD